MWYVRYSICVRNRANREQLIWSAALASNASTSNVESVIIMCKDETGAVVPWPNAHDVSQGQYKGARHPERDSPLARLGELFNVNHFIISQARPYLAPFLRSDFHRVDPRHLRRWRVSIPLGRLAMLELQHRLGQLEAFGLLPAAVRRFLLDESVPGPSVLLVPDLTPSDFVRLLENPSKTSMRHWILKGERSVWPTMAAIRTRCAIEFELDRGYQLVRRRKPFDTATPKVPRSRRESNTGSLRRVSRANSFIGGAET
jgi:TAG lipase/lysophosphatidylethanolamine acyltransferase